MGVVKSTNYDALLSSRARLVGARGGVGGGSAALAPLYLFGAGQPDPSSFPYKDIVTATEEAITAEGRQLFMYGDGMGYRELRNLVCEKTRHFEGFEVTPEELLITNGSSHAISLVCDAFVDLGDVIISEAPTFSGTLHTFRRYGPEIIGVGLDDEGIRTDELEERLKDLDRQGRKAKFIYTIVNFQNPAGMTQSLRRRQELLRFAEKYDTLILEDDAYGELRYDGEPIRSLYGLDESGRVIRSGTLSKILGAGVRLGWVLAPKELIPRVAAFKSDGGTNPYVSRVATFYMRKHMVPHVDELRGIYRAKRDLMLERLHAGLGDRARVSRPDGGFFIWIRLPEGTDQAKLAELAAERRVQYVPGTAFYPNPQDGSNHIRLAFSFASLDEIRAGTDLMCEAINAAR
ncbi:MAG TPA: PLP-dependent aminotransferase family protein [Chloroflexota bacterium]|nr:PLP-dependent aminotransferase family protein [Chloroflexota bacterium]